MKFNLNIIWYHYNLLAFRAIFIWVPNTFPFVTYNIVYLDVFCSFFLSIFFSSSCVCLCAFLRLFFHMSSSLGHTFSISVMSHSLFFRCNGYIFTVFLTCITLRLSVSLYFSSLVDSMKIFYFLSLKFYALLLNEWKCSAHAFPSSNFIKRIRNLTRNFASIF